MDSGLSTIVLDYEMYRAVFDIIQPDQDFDTGLLTVPCHQKTSLPAFVFAIGEQNFTVASFQYVIDVREAKTSGCTIRFVLGRIG